MTIRTFPTEYTVTGLPDDHVDAGAFLVQVSWRDVDRWAITHLSMCLNADGEWDYEPSPSNRDEAFLSSHRFSLDDALARAVVVYPTVVVNGHVVRDGRVVRATP